MLLHLLILISTLHCCVVCVDSCGRGNVSAAVGGDVILRVHQTDITLINWVLGSELNVIITTKPGRSIDDDEVRTQWRGRVRSEANGSLHIYNLSHQDQGIYNADIRTRNGESCVQFNLTVYERLSPGVIKINHSFTSNDTCSLSLLCTVDKRDVTITWSSLNRSDINVMDGVLYLPPSDVNYTYICTACNPVSNVSKTVIPWEYCKREAENSSELQNKRAYFAFIIAAIVIVFFVCVILAFKWKRKIQKKENVSTAYAQVGAFQRQEGNHYHQEQEEKQASVTVYSEVQHAKKTNSQKKLVGKEAAPAETVYSTVSLPKESQNNGTGAQSAGPSNHKNMADAKKNTLSKEVGWKRSKCKRNRLQHSLTTQGITRT